MKQYLIRRLAGMLPILFFVSLLMFVLFKLMPGDPVSSVLDPKMSMETRKEIKDRMGLNDNVMVQYGRWLKKAVVFDFGESISYRKPVKQVIGDYIWNTVLLNIVVLVLAYLIAIPLGIISATRQYSFTDMALTTFALFGISMPLFFFGLLLMKWLAVDLRLLPVSGMRTAGGNYTGIKAAIDIGYHMILPVIVLTLGSLAGLMRYTRSSMLEVIRQDYIRTARSKGLTEKVVIYKHAFRNGMIPIATFLGMAIVGIFAGGIISEKIFVWPGIGQVFFKALNKRDYMFIMGYQMISALLVLFGNLFSDILVAFTDPRIRLS